MNAKLTLRLNKDAIARVKSFAQKEQTSLSVLEAWPKTPGVARSRLPGCLKRVGVATHPGTSRWSDTRGERLFGYTSRVENYFKSLSKEEENPDLELSPIVQDLSGIIELPEDFDSKEDVVESGK